MRKLASSLLVALALIVPMLTASTASAATAGHHSGHRHKAHSHHKRHRSGHHGHRGHAHQHKSGGNTRVWDRLAQCESGGRWHIATGNGYYGGVQISASTWRAYGGARYASLPHKASKSDQIKVAQRIKKGQGWGAWPSCSRRIGAR